MNKTKIDWCDMTWNPVTGCLHNCPYCYARKIAERFAPRLDNGKIAETGQLHSIKDTNIPFSFGFDPTFHIYRLDEPQKVKTPQKVFVCSMADLFGDWIPEEWIQEVFEACEKAPQHQYLFLTKNPIRYAGMEHKHNWWLGSTITDQNDLLILRQSEVMGEIDFLSIEPFLGEIIPNDLYHCCRSDSEFFAKWIIIGQQTNPNIEPKPEWVTSIIDECRAANVPIFIKEPLYQKYPIQEYPIGLRR